LKASTPRAHCVKHSYCRRNQSEVPVHNMVWQGGTSGRGSENSSCSGVLLKPGVHCSYEICSYRMQDVQSGRRSRDGVLNWVWKGVVDSLALMQGWTSLLVLSPTRPHATPHRRCACCRISYNVPEDSTLAARFIYDFVNVKVALQRGIN
jgi:hypothetical protein